jgi:hypothetical protein
MTRCARASHYDEVLCLGTCHPSSRRLTLVNLSEFGREPSGHGDRAEQCLKLNSSEDLSTSGRYPGTSEHERGSPAASSLNQQIFLVTVPSRTSSVSLIE